MTHHDGTETEHAHNADHVAATAVDRDGAAQEDTRRVDIDAATDSDAEAADYVHGVDHGAGTDEELTDGSDKGSFTTSTDFGEETAAPNALREDGDYVSSPHNGSLEDGEYVDPNDQGREA